MFENVYAAIKTPVDNLGKSSRLKAQLQKLINEMTMC